MWERRDRVMPDRGKAARAFAVSALTTFGLVVGYLVGREAVVGLMALAMFPVAFGWFRRLARPTPTLTLTADALLVRNSAVIPWEELQGLEVFRLHARFLAFQVTHPRTVLVPTNLPMRAWRAINRAVEGAPVSITENMIEGRFEDIVPMILRKKTVPVEWRDRT